MTIVKVAYEVYIGQCSSSNPVVAHYILTALKGCVVKTFCLHIVAFLKTRALGERRPLPSADPDDPDSDPAFLFFSSYTFLLVFYLKII